ncbi:MAG TPA: cytochrome b [Thiolinea sp.]|nr:cytochrome b [Thiolinea sp.]
MQTFNTRQDWGWVSILLHWVMAILLIGLYFVGDYMVGLSYYDRLYHTLPALHKAIGVLRGFLLLFRLLWLLVQPQPGQPPGGTPLLNRLATLGHVALYALMFIMIISGYLISTAKGKGIDIFGLFELPALLASDAGRGELAGKIHAWAGTAFILLVGLHALAALAHHFFWKDNTLTRMLGIKTIKE